VNRTVVAIIKGGLGNQLFAYAAARAFALRSGRDLLVDAHSGFTRDGYQRQFRLDRLPITGRLAPPELCLGDPKRARYRWTRQLNKILPPNRRNYLREKPDQTPSQLLGFQSKRDLVHLDGYWQDEAYFIDRERKIRAELAPPPFPEGPLAELQREIATTPSVSIHLRRVRYPRRLTANYYNSAIQSALAIEPEACFEVFGDEVDWARERLDFAGRPARFHQPAEDELDDFRLLSACRHAIVANSSFSWWAAWLDPHPARRVWTPGNPGWPIQPAKGWTPVPNRLEA